MAAAFRAALGVLLGLFARGYLATLRVRVAADPALLRTDERPWVLVFWHGEQFSLLAWPRRKPTFTLVSWSNDGQIQARALTRIGLLVERGSTSKGGARGLAALVRRLSAGYDAAFAVDGPRGPRFTVHPGARLAAERSGGTIVPIGATVEHSWVLGRAWDKFRIPYPFSRVVIRLGAPLDPRTATPEAIARAIHGTAGEGGLPAPGFSPGEAPC